MNNSDSTPIDNDKICVIIPTYNNEKTIVSVINDVLGYTNKIIVVNDGSTDDTKQLLQSFTSIFQIEFDKNKGKGSALRAAFKFALDKGFQYAITIDSDGQHFAKDIPLFIDKLQEERNAIIIGSRNMTQENVPGTSSFGNKFSNFWFTVETGIKLPDTQSGFRLYPLQPLSKLWLFTWRYEFEVEVLVKAAWHQVDVICIPIDVYYPPKKERITHFRKGPDFTRISILNTYLFLLALLFYRPRHFFLHFKTNMKSFWRDQLIASHESNYIKAASIGLGICMGIFPVWGFQMLIATIIAFYFKLNKVIVLVVSNISFGPLGIFWAFAGLFVGKKLLGKSISFQEFNWHLAFADLKQNVLAFFLGGIVLAIVLGFITFLLSILLLHFVRKEKK